MRETTQTDADRWPKTRLWTVTVAVVIGLIFLYFYQPFEIYLVERIPHVHFSNVIFWFASLVAVIGYLLAHWQSLRHQVSASSGSLNAESLVFDTLQVAILTAVIFSAGATLQAVVMLGEHLMNRGPIIDAAFGEKLLAIVLLVILAIVFYLLHHLVRAFRSGWTPRHPPPRVPGPQS
ncbi:MAG: hypothetical protein ACR2RL_20555 [Gammaproteobacteria bacterium]